ncbi:hypothetical protein EJ04DRAFT_130381 [Polyplosphaeria fusca]|uniref:Uncharacterized protein n=1 Tax=Polyplosphaeria fusca TaxID=682080 RepID=A0A9P4R0G7_9PLEO|nr:hypothetical protein EJ04DRAFT_130381 [Polyplosphaeria fusca]
MGRSGQQGRLRFQTPKICMAMSVPIATLAHIHSFCTSMARYPRQSELGCAHCPASPPPVSRVVEPCPTGASAIPRGVEGGEARQVGKRSEYASRRGTSPRETGQVIDA